MGEYHVHTSFKWVAGPIFPSLSRGRCLASPAVMDRVRRHVAMVSLITWRHSDMAPKRRCWASTVRVKVWWARDCLGSLSDQVGISSDQSRGVTCIGTSAR